MNDMQIKKEIVFNGTESMSLIIHTNEGKTTQNEYSFAEISQTELIHHRLSNIPGFVLKKDGRLFYTQMPDINLISYKYMSGDGHQCTNCKRLSAAPVCKGGCQKVKDRSVSDLKPNQRTANAVRNSKCIERYEFIKDGYETFNMTLEVLYVGKCNNFTT